MKKSEALKKAIETMIDNYTSDEFDAIVTLCKVYEDAKFCEEVSKNA